MLALELLDRLVPPRGSVLVRRDERARMVRGIWIPDRARQGSRAATATIVRVSPEIRELAAGDRVLLAATVGARSIRLGATGELVLEVCRPHQVLARIREADSAELSIENRGEHPLAGFSPSQIHPTGPVFHLEPFDEGDPLAIQ